MSNWLTDTIALEDLWPYVQEQYKKAEARNDLKGQQWCNYFEMLICNADHKKINIEEN